MQRFTTVLFLSLVGSVFGATHKVPNDEPIATISIPDKWQTKELGEGIETTSPDGGLHLIAIPPERNKVAEGIGELMRYIRNTGRIVVKPESVKNQTGTTNGLETRNVSWQGTDKDGGEVNIRYTIVSFDNTKSLIIVRWGPPKAEQKYETAVKKMLRSLKKA